MGGRCTGYDLKHGVRSRRIGVGACLAAGPRAVPVLYQFQYFVARLHHLLRQSDDLYLKRGTRAGFYIHAARKEERKECERYLLFPILQNAKFFLVRQQIEHFPRINFEETRGNDEVQGAIFGQFETLKHVVGNHRVYTFLAILSFPVKIAAHRVGFPASRLTVCETGGHPTLEDRLDQRFRRVLVHDLVVARLVERVVETENLILQIFGEIDFGLRLVYHHLIFAGHADHVHLFPRYLLLVQGALSHAHGDLVILHHVRLPERPELDAVLILPVNGRKNGAGGRDILKRFSTF